MYKKGKYSDYEDNFILENYQTMTYKEIGEYLNRKEISINDRIRKLNLIKIKKDIWTDEEIATLEKYYNKTIGVFDMFPGRTRQSIAYKAHDLGLKKFNRGDHLVNYDFFKTWSSDMAYILGLIYADGNIMMSPKRLTVTLHKNDLYMLEELSLKMETNRDIAKRRTNCRDFVITCGEIVDDLIELGVTPKKSLTVKWFSGIPKEYLKDFIRGYIDGDGCVCTYKRNRGKYTETIIEVSILGTRDFLEGMSKEISQEIGIKEVKVFDVKNSNIHRMKYSYKSAKALLEWLYKDGLGLHLKRKKDVFDNYQQQDASSNLKRLNL